MSTNFKNSGKLSTAFLSAFLAFSSVAHAQSLEPEKPLEKHLLDFVTAVRNKDGRQVVTSLEGATIRFSKLYKEVKENRIVKGIVEPTAEVLESINLGLAALAQEPVELDALTDMIKRDTAKLEKIKPEMPSCVNPLLGVSEQALQSTDPKVRGPALDKLRAQGKRIRDSHEPKVTELEEQRKQAQDLVQQAIDTDRRGYELEKVLEEINSSPAGGLFNIGGGKLVYMLVEMGAYVRPALAGRENEAKDLVKRYDTVIAETKRTLWRQELFDSWPTFHGSARENFNDKAQPKFSQKQEKETILKEHATLQELAWAICPGGGGVRPMPPVISVQ